MKKGPTCTKGGVKIHQSPNEQSRPKTYQQQPRQYLQPPLPQQQQQQPPQSQLRQPVHSSTQLVQTRPSPSSSPSIQIAQQQQRSNSKPSTSVDYYNTNMKNLDLNIENYSLQDLYRLFNITELTAETIKRAKYVTTKIHPDKSRLDAKYFIFFFKAYKLLLDVYQNGAARAATSMSSSSSDDATLSSNLKTRANDDDGDYSIDESKIRSLNEFFNQNKHIIEDPSRFNEWFNEQFEKFQFEEDKTGAYDDWFRSEDAIYDVQGKKVTKQNMNEMFEAQKKTAQSLIMYTGVHDVVSASSVGGTALDRQSVTNYGSSDQRYSDLKQAYTESVLPVSEDAFQNMPKYRNVNEYKNAREMAQRGVRPMTEDEANHMFNAEKQKGDREYEDYLYRQNMENRQAIGKRDAFWSGILRITDR